MQADETRLLHVYKTQVISVFVDICPSQKSNKTCVLDKKVPFLSSINKIMDKKRSLQPSIFKE